MGLLADLQKEVKEIFREQWDASNAQVVPDPTSLRLSNDARYFKRATILYADLAGSTDLVNSKTWGFAGEIYKTYLLCAAKIIRQKEGVITAYDGDRIMAVFIGDSQTSSAAIAALKINWAVINIINPAIKAQYPEANYAVRQVVGIDTSEIRAARIGVRGGNDLVWIGRAANHAAKLTAFSSDYPTWITREAYGYLNDDAKYGGNPRREMWERKIAHAMGGADVYASNWWWCVD